MLLFRGNFYFVLFCFFVLQLKINECSNRATNPELRPNRDKAPWSAERLLTGTGSSLGCPSHPPGGAPTPSASHCGRPGWTRPGGRPLGRGHLASGRRPAGTDLDAGRQTGSLVVSCQHIKPCSRGVATVCLTLWRCRTGKLQKPNECKLQMERNWLNLRLSRLHLAGGGRRQCCLRCLHWFTKW